MSIESNPYPGPKPFEGTEKDFFFGRDYESREIFSLVVAHQAVLLYAQSGAGKTSLFNASLVPRFLKEGFQTLPLALIRTPIPDSLKTDDLPNPYVLATLLSWAEKKADPRQLVHCSISQFLKNQPAPDKEKEASAARVLIFDQFEDLFTLYPEHWADRGRFFEQLAEALASNPMLRVIIGMREEYLGRLNAYANMLPEALDTRFRLERLDEDAAREAIVKPLTNTSRHFSQDALDKLVNDLLKVRVTIDQKTTREVTGEHVEPVQLQVVCHELWADLPADVAEITVEHLGTFGDVTEALSGFYEKSIKEAAQKAGLKEGRLRQWFEQELITTVGTRGTVFREPKTTGGIPNLVVDVLESQHLIRADSRAGAAWYELTHDRFIGPILKSNARWRQARGEADQIRQRLEAEATKWDERGRPPDQLLNETQLDEARRWLNSSDAAELGCSDRLLALVSASTVEVQQKKERQQRTEAQARAARRFRRLAIVSAAFCVMALIALSYGLWERTHALGFERRMKSVRLAAVAVNQVSVAPDRSVLLAMHAMAAEPTPQAIDALNRALHALRLERTLTEHSGEITHVTFSRDGKLLASGATDHTVRIWDTETWKVVRTFELGSADLRSLGFSPDGKTIMTASNEGKKGNLTLWDVQTGKPLPPIKPPGKNISRAIYHPREPVIATVEDSAFDQSTIYLWNASAKPYEISHWNIKGWINELAFSNSGKSLASAGYDKVVRVWQWAACKRSPDCKPYLTLIGHSDQVMGVAFSPDDQFVASAGMDRTVRIWNAKDGTSHQVLTGHTNTVFAVAFDSVGRLVSSGADARAIVWDPISGRELLNFAGHTGPVETVTFSPDGTLVVSGSWDKAIKIWNAACHGNGITSVQFTPDGGRLITGSRDKTVKLWDSTTGRELGTLRFKHEVDQVKFNREGELLGVSVSGEGVHIQDAQSGKGLLHLPVRDIATTISFNPRAPQLATGSDQGRLLLWELKAGVPPRQMGRLGFQVNAVAFSPDGTLLASGSSDHMARLWKTSAGSEEPVILEGHKTDVMGLAFSPDGATLATAGLDVSAKLWSTASGKELYTLTGHSNAVSDVAFSPDGKYLVTASWDRTAKLWNAKTRHEEMSFTFDSSLNAIAFSPDGKRLAVATEDTTPQVYVLDEGNLMQQARERMGRLGRVLQPDECARFLDSKNGCPPMP